MVVFQANNICKSFGEYQVLKSATLVLQEKERVGLVGANGSGKTTLLKCLSGEIEIDRGETAQANGLTMGYMEQLPQLDDEVSLWEAMMDSFSAILQMRQQLRRLEQEMGRDESRLESIMASYAQVTEQYERAGGYGCEAAARRMMLGLGFTEEDFNKPFNQLSGGEKTRLNLGRLLAVQADIILLDEPTNHLDMASLEWLEEWLRNYPGTVLLVSHDRMFLDRLVARIVELKDGHMTSYRGNYSAYLKLKANKEEAELRAYEKQQDYIRETEDYIRKYKAGIKARQAKGRKSQLDHLERLERPGGERSISSWNLQPEFESGQDVLVAENITKSFAAKKVLGGIDLSIRKGEKIALTGPNGCGKSTLLKIIAGLTEPDQGKIRLGSRVKIGYFSQGFEDLDPDNTVLNEIICNSRLELGAARSLLGGMLFRGDDVFKTVDCLSGGERGRLSLLKVILSQANFLILDEPTNHLDIESRQVVEELLQAYSGTVLLVSHDRYFIDRLVDCTVVMEEGRLELYPGNYTYYYEKQKLLKADQIISEKTERRGASPQQQLRLEQKDWQRQAKQLQISLQRAEDEIQELERRKGELETLLSDPAIYNDNNGQARAYSQEYRQVDEELSGAYVSWEGLLAEIEEHDSKGSA